MALLQSALEDAERDLHARGLRRGRAVGQRSTRSRSAIRSRRAPVVGGAFTRGPFPLRGSPFVPAAGQYAHARPAAVTGGASYRQVVDLADIEGRSRR